MDDASVSQVFFRDGNKIEADLHFGCSVMVFNNQNTNDLSQLLEFFTQLSAEKDDPRWEQFSSFFMSINANAEVSFHDAGSGSMDLGILKTIIGDVPENVKEQHRDFMNKLYPYVNMKLEKFSPRVKELRLKNSEGEYDSAGRQHLNNKISRIESTLNEPGIKMITDFFNKGFPFVPFPQIERCLGMGIKDAVVQIKDGYAIMGYDFKVQRSTTNCLFNMQETIKERELREIERAKQSSGNSLEKVGSMVRMIQEQIANQKVQIPGYDFSKLAEKFNNDRAEMLKDMI